MNKGLKVAGLAVAGVVALTACNPGSGSTVYYKSGPAGQVVDRDIEDGHYELEVKTAKGKKKEFNVTFSVYNDCHLYSYYPSCVKHRNDHKTVTPQYKKQQEQKRKAEQRKKSLNKNKTSKSKGFGFGSGSGFKSKRR